MLSHSDIIKQPRHKGAPAPGLSLFIVSSALESCCRIADACSRARVHPGNFTKVSRVNRCFLTLPGDNAVSNRTIWVGLYTIKGELDMAANRFRNAVLVVTGLCLAGTVALGAEAKDDLKKGKPDLKSAVKLAFGPDGILFVGDTAGAAIFAIDTGDKAESAAKAPLAVKDVSGKIAAMLGTDARQILITDLAVNPRSGNVYLAVSRGRGPESAPLLVRVKADGKIEEFSLEDVPFAKAEIPGAPEANTKATRGPSPRSLSVTDLAYADGRVFLAGLSNEEFSSRLIAIPYPFSSEGIDGASIEIYHGAHGALETKSPIRTFVTYRIGSEPYMLAAYTCTPLVKVAVSELKAGAHVKGTTIAELGNRNNPLDMIVYQKDGKDYLLMTNSARGVMKIPTEGAGEAPGITEPVRGGGKKGLGYETIESLKGVQEMDQLDKTHAVVLVKEGEGALNLETIELP
jgi:hypothetical protein